MATSNNETLKRLRRMYHHERAYSRHKVHQMALNDPDSLCVAVKFWELEYNTTPYSRPSTLPEFLLGISRGEFPQLTFKGLKILWFQNETRIIHVELRSDMPNDGDDGNDKGSPK